MAAPHQCCKHGKLGGLSPRQLTRAGLVPLCPPGRRLVGSSCQNPHLLSPRNLISIRCWPLAVWHGTGALEGLLSPLEQKKKKRKPLLIPKGWAAKQPLGNAALGNRIH